jgi:ABC-type transport system involved in cytochrome c biogenesis permease component
MISRKFKIFIPLLKRELLLIKYNFGMLIFALLSSLTVFFIYFLILDKLMLSDQATTYGLILITTILTIGFSDYLSVQEEFRDGVLEQLLLLPISPIKIILTKLCIGFIRYIVIHSFFWYFIWLIIYDTNFFSVYLNYLLFIIHLMAVSLLIVSISLSIKQHNNIIHYTLLIPMIFPQIILSILSLKSPIYLLLILGLDILLLPVFIIFSTIVIQNAIRDST